MRGSEELRYYRIDDNATSNSEIENKELIVMVRSSMRKEL